MNLDYITTTQAAHIASVSPTLIRRWCDTKLIKCFKLPGSNGHRHRRICVVSLRKFLTDNQWPVALVDTAIERRSTP